MAIYVLFSKSKNHICYYTAAAHPFAMAHNNPWMTRTYVGNIRQSRTSSAVYIQGNCRERDNWRSLKSWRIRTSCKRTLRALESGGCASIKLSPAFSYIGVSKPCCKPCFQWVIAYKYTMRNNVLTKMISAHTELGRDWGSVKHRFKAKLILSS